MYIGVSACHNSGRYLKTLNFLIRRQYCFQAEWSKEARGNKFLRYFNNIFAHLYHSRQEGLSYYYREISDYDIGGVNLFLWQGHLVSCRYPSQAVNIAFISFIETHYFSLSGQGAVEIMDVHVYSYNIFLNDVFLRGRMEPYLPS